MPWWKRSAELGPPRPVIEMDPLELANYIDAYLGAHADPAFAAGQRRFFLHEVDTYGVRTAALKPLVSDVARRIKAWPAAERDRLMTLLWQSGKLETGALACHVYRRHARNQFDLFETWIDRYVHNWAHCDGVSSWLLAACIKYNPELRHRLPPWTASENRWKRRAAAVSFLQEAKHGRHTEFIFDIAARLLADRDDMVEKGVGWLLKETYPMRPAETLAFLVSHATAASRLTLRYAAEKMSPADRRTLLGGRLH
jgi:3-methyladenine DNA glycosylase AlkD